MEGKPTHLNFSEFIIRDKRSMLLVSDTIKRLLEKKENEATTNEDQKILTLARGIVATDLFKMVDSGNQRLLDEKMVESEKLIESPEAHTPEVKEKRRILRDQINEHLDYAQEIKKLIPTLSSFDIMLRLATPDEEAKAREEAVRLTHEVNRILHPEMGLN